MKVDGGAWRLVDRVVDHREQKWTKHYLDISDLADGHTHVQFRFTYFSNDLIELSGWNIDDFTVLEAAPFTGIKTVNSAGFPGGDVYNSLAAAIDDINTHGVGASGLTVNVSAGSVFNEEIPPLVVSGPSAGNPILIRKSGVGANPVIDSNGNVQSEEDAAFTLWGASHVRISEIDINSSSSFLEYGYFVSSNDFLVGSQHIDISGCNITIQNPVRGGTGIYQEVMAHPEDQDGTNSFNNYFNNTITARDGITLTNAQVLINPLFYDLDCEVFGNSIQGYPNDLPSLIPTTFLGITAIGFDGVRIYQNEVSEFYASEAGIGIQGFWGTGGMIYQNRVHDLVLNCSTAGQAITGMRVEGCRVYNNMIYNLDSNRNDSGNHYSVRGIIPDGYCDVDFNTVWIGTEDFVEYQSVACYMGDASSVGYNRIRNNIFANINDCIFGGVSHYCIVARENIYHPSMGGFSNYNIYYTGGGASYIGLYGEEEAVILGGWRSLTHNDYHSYDIDPQLISATNLHINPAVETPVEGRASYSAGLYEITWITHDFDGDLRSTTKPDIGADEGAFLPLYYPPLPASLFDPADPCPDVPINQNPLLTWTINYGPTPLSDPTYTYTYFSTEQADVTALAPAALVQGDGSTVHNSYISPVFLDPLTTYFWRVVVGNPAGVETSSVYSFTTGSDAVVTEYPFTEDFEDAANPPALWVSAYNWEWEGGLNGNNLITIPMGGWIPDGTPENVHNGSYAMTSPPFGQPSYDWLITPSFQFPSVSTPELGFWLAYNQQPGFFNAFYVLVYAGGTWTVLATWNNPVHNTLYDSEVVIDLSAYAGETVKLAFVASPDNAMAPLSIDDVEVRVTYTGYYAYEGSIPVGDTTVELTAITLEEYDIDYLELDTGATAAEVRDVTMELTAGASPYPVPVVSMIGFSCTGSIGDPPIDEALIHFEYTGPRLTNVYQWSFTRSIWVEVALISESYDAGSGVLVFLLDMSAGFKGRGTDFEFLAAKGDIEGETLPIVLSSFTAVLNANRQVLLEWTTQSETGVLGFYLHRSDTDQLSDAIQTGNLIEATNTAIAHTYGYTDTDVETGNTYHYWLQGIDYDGRIFYSDPVSILVNQEAEENNPQTPLVTKLMNAFPNPFNPNTNLRYSLKTGGRVKIEIYNIKGQKVRTLEREHAAAGYYSTVFNGLDQSGKPLGSGVYYYTMSFDGYRATRKMLLMK